VLAISYKDWNSVNLQTQSLVKEMQKTHSQELYIQFLIHVHVALLTNIINNVLYVTETVN
jgi:hypothetical protein